ncbi:MAG: hypothetical protein OEY49_17940 [Candidatus Heimdallarchaeota archaeon]|nr:hypothetical protein [Candidatus Heimdallarchaeota archaeon]
MKNAVKKVIQLAAEVMKVIYVISEQSLFYLVNSISDFMENSSGVSSQDNLEINIGYMNNVINMNIQLIDMYDTILDMDLPVVSISIVIHLNGLQISQTITQGLLNFWMNDITTPITNNLNSYVNTNNTIGLNQINSKLIDNNEFSVGLAFGLASNILYGVTIPLLIGNKDVLARISIHLYLPVSSITAFGLIQNYKTRHPSVKISSVVFGVAAMYAVFAYSTILSLSGKFDNNRILSDVDNSWMFAGILITLGYSKEGLISASFHVAGQSILLLNYLIQRVKNINSDGTGILRSMAKVSMLLSIIFSIFAFYYASLEDNV